MSQRLVLHVFGTYVHAKAAFHEERMPYIRNGYLMRPQHMDFIKPEERIWFVVADRAERFMGLLPNMVLWRDMRSANQRAVEVIRSRIGRVRP